MRLSDFRYYKNSIMLITKVKKKVISLNMKKFIIIVSLILLMKP